jgi:hypothetical protein
MSLSLRRDVKVFLSLMVLLAGWIGLDAQVSLSPKEFHQRVVKAKALPDDPVAAVHRLLSLPPVTTAVASFRGNQTAILASPQNAFAMVRETNCSLTAFNAMYSLSTSASGFNYASRTFNFDQQLHSAAGLTTTGGTFTGGCKDPGTGVVSNSLIYAGITPSQMRVGALAVYNSQSGNNQLFTVVSKEDGMLVGITTQPAPTGVGANSYPYAVVAGDLNKDGINDLVSVNYVLGSTAFSSITVLLGKTDGSFAAGVSYAVPGAIAQTLVMDDFDGDGKLDLVVPSATAPNTNNNASEVTFFPGNGDGTFGTVKTTVVTGTSPVFGSLGDGSVSGDFNGDGKKDLISSYGVVLLGKGDGTFTQVSATAFPTLVTNSNQGPQLAAGDFNKDGKLDIAVGTGDSIYIYFGNGDGTFAAGGSYASIDNSGYLTATDLDGDGNLDLFSGDATNGIFGGDSFTPNAGYALMGKGDGKFVGAPQTNASAVTQLEDLNGDGKLDYVAMVPNVQTGGSLNVFLGNGDGSFKTPAPITLTPFTYNGTSYSVGGFASYALVDVDGDGHLDVVALPAGYFNLNPTRPGFVIALGKSDGTFQAPTFTPFPSLIPGGGQDYVYGVKGLFAAKRADGKSEIVYSFLTQDFNNQFLYYEGFATQAVTGNGSLGAPATTDTYSGAQPPNGSQTLTISVSQFTDLNGDSTPDIVQYVPAVFGNGGMVTTPQSFQVYLGKTDGTFGTAATVSAVANPLGPIAVADLNGDGKPDLIAEGNTGSNGIGEIGVALGNGDGTFQTPKTFTLSTLPTNRPSLAVGDFDGDGKADLAILGFQPPYDSGVFLGNGDGTFQSVASGANDGSVAPSQPIELATATNSQSLIAADIDGDGKIDIVGPTVLINQYGTMTTPPAKTNTTTTLAASPTSANAGANVTLTATVTGTGATGTVTFVDGSTTLGSGTLNASGVATLTVSTLAVGSHSITAVYSGDSSFNGSTSSAVTVTVTGAKLASQTTISASSYSITVEQSVTLTATVMGSGATPTGTVTFLNHGTTTIGTAMLDAQGVAMLVVSNFTVGSQGVSASYGGDSVYNSSSSGSTTIVVAAATNVNTATALTASATSITAGASVNFTATVTAASGSAIPTGTVTFLNGSTTLGTGTLNSTGVATLTGVTSLAVGTQSITASYGGGPGFNSSVSSAVSVTVTAAATPDFSVALSPATATLASGSSATSTVTITPTGGFTSAVTLSCSGLPSNSTCSFSAGSVTPSGSAATSTLTIKTGVSTTAQLERFGGVSFAGVGLFGLIGLGLRRKKFAVRLVCLLFAMAGAAMVLSGCGSSHHAAGITTPSGTYTVSVTGTAGTTTHSSSFTLTVQ